MLRKPVSKRSVISISLRLLTLAALLTSLFFAGTARAQSQSPAYVGKFTFTINSTVAPIIGTIRTVAGDGVSIVMSQARTGNKNSVNGLLIKEKDGQPTVHSLAIADLGVVLIYDPTLARETVQEARVSQTIPVTWAKK
jgi:hypothetical protein